MTFPKVVELGLDADVMVESRFRFGSDTADGMMVNGTASKRSKIE